MGNAGTAVERPVFKSTTQPQQQAYIPATQSGTVCVTVENSEGQPLGATLQKQGERVVFLNIKPDGRLIKSWKLQNPCKPLQPGCILVSVNGVCQCYDQMSKELWGIGKKVLEVMEGSPLDSCPQVLAADYNIETCRICFENLQPESVLIELPCKHGFHEECIGHWFAMGKGSCPLCVRFVCERLDTTIAEIQ